ncbi:MAG: prenyltransferase/squalene oxidase repeat-containing protein [Thermoguttaceae bacterium]
MNSEDDNGQGRRISHRRFNAARQLAIVIYIWLSTGWLGFSAEAPGSPPRFGPDPQQYQRSVDRAIAYLQSRGQAEDGSFNSRAGVGITALVTTGVLRHGRGSGDPLAAKSLKYLGDFVQSDGGIYAREGMLPNYETCMVIMCLSEANKDNRYNGVIRSAEAFIKRSQWGEAAGRDRSDLSYGGTGYGKDSRPDLSNTAYFIDALKACGNGSDDPGIQKALQFVSRCQNLETEHNTTPFAAKNPDGGFYYTCVAGGGSPAGKTDNGGLRSYGSMTYSGLKSMIYAGVKPDDPRVKAALQWIRKNYDVKNNPGLGQAGLYYYYNVFAKSLDALGDDMFEDAAGKKHDWRRELAEELFSRQKEDGSWINGNTKWMEGDPNLATGFALLALSYCRPKK